MAALTVELRNLIYTEILAQKAATNYVVNNFAVEKVWYPYQRLEELLGEYPNGVLYLIAQASDDTPNQGREGCHVLTKEIAVMFGFMKALDGFQTTAQIAAVDTLVQLVEEIQYTCFKDVTGDHFSFIRNEYLKDDNGLPYSYTGMRETSTFESYFMTYFRTTIS